MGASVKPEQQLPTDEAWKKLNEDIAAEAVDEEQRGAPMRSFMDRLINGSGEPRLQATVTRAKEIGRSVIRGAAQFANETANTIQAGVDLSKGRPATDNRVVPQEDIDEVYGKRSDDPIAGFAESAAQFVAGFAALGPLGAGTGVAARIGVAAAKGAVVDAVAFNPDEAGLAELAARAPEGYGIRELGEALSVNGEDSELEKRVKRGAAGIIPGVALDGLIAAAKYGWAKQAVRAAKTADQRMAAERVAAKHAQILGNIADGSYVPEGAHVVVKANPDGTYSMKPTAPSVGITDEPVRTLQEVRGPRFSDRAEAEAQAETINFAMNERVNAAKSAGGLTKDQAEELRSTFRNFLTATDDASLRAMTEGTHFNFSYYSEPKEVLAQIEAVSKVFKKELDAAQIVDGVSIEKQALRIREMLGGLDREQAPGLVATMVERGSREVPESVLLGAADIVLRDVALKSSKLFDIVTARPHDVIAWEEARHAAGSLLRLQRVIAEAHSETGRALRFMQDRDTFAKTVGKQMKDAAEKETIEVRAARQARMDSQGGLVEPKYKNPYLPESPAHAAYKKAWDEAIDPTKFGKDLPEGAQLTPDGKISVDEETLAKGNGAKSAREEMLDAEAQAVAGMSQREVMAVLKMAKASGGEPSKLGAIRGAATIIQETSFIRRALEFFVNSALSNPVTPATALLMNGMVSTYEAASRMFTGALMANKPLMREGWDILAANERFIADNLKTAAMAFRQGHSVIRPGEVHVAIPGKAGEIIRTPGKALLFADEFTRVTNYRSFVYAKSSRFWREKGLEGEALAKAVSSDLRDAFDAKTGVAVIPDGMKYAELPTMSADLGRETLGGGLASFLNNHVEAKFIAPFVKTSVNIFRYTFDRTPLLNMAAKRNREIFREGGEAAAVLHTQSLIATGTFFYGYMKAKSGEITGSGPKEPGLRKLWMQDHKPYSIKINGEWVSYRRLDPLFTPLSLMADVHDMVQELGSDSEADAEDIIAGSLAGIAAAFANKSYMVGMTQFFEAWSGGKGDMMKRWLQGMGTTFTNPQIIRAVNDDPYLREVSSFKDAVMAGIPGLSDKLPARHNMFGEPELRSHSFMPAPVRGKAEETVATDLLALGRGIVPMNRKNIFGVEVDLTDSQKFGKVDGLSPYEFAQKILREPGDGEPSLRAALTELVKSDEYKDASPGTEQFPGGERFVMAYRIIDSYRRRALGEVIDRFPLVEQEFEMQKNIKGASFSEGEAGALEVLREYGKSR